MLLFPFLWDNNSVPISKDCLMKNFRVRCVNTPSEGKMLDSHISKGNFYTVTDVGQSNGVEFFTIMGDLKTEVVRPSHHFIRFRKGN